MYVFLAGACACLSFSGICHTLACVSAQVSSIVWRIDYVGIVTLIMASFYPVVYYSFMCVPALRTFYLVGISLFGSVVLSVMLLERFQAPKYTPFRAVLFSGLGAFGIFPLLHQTLFTWRIVPTPMVVTFWLEILMGMCYLGGAFIYARAVPERWNPGRFDVWGGTLCSHNLFHVLVVAGAYVHYRAALVLIAWRDHHRCDADATLLRTFYLDNGWLGGRHHVPWIPHGEL
jgi:adiponectin receptor